MDWWIIFAIFLYFVSAALLIIEVFVPSGGLISICSFGCLIAGVSIFFRYSIMAGWIGIGIALVMIPTVVIIAYRIFPRTRFGKSVTLTPSERHAGDAIPDTEELKGLVGKEGVVYTPLRPVGTCEFSGEKIECMAESGYVEKGKKVKVIEVESTRVTVRVVDES